MCGTAQSGWLVFSILIWRRAVLVLQGVWDPIRAYGDLGAKRRSIGVEIPGGIIGQPFGIASISVHHVDVPKPSPVRRIGYPVAVGRPIWVKFIVDAPGDVNQA